MASLLTHAKPRFRAARLAWMIALAFGSVGVATLSGCASMAADGGDPGSAKTADAAGRSGAKAGEKSAQSEDENGARAGGPDSSGPGGSYRPDNLPNVALTPPLLAKILAAEIGLQRQQLSTSYSTYQDLAIRTRDARLARRATEIALGGRAFEQALASAQLWSELDPASTESQQTLETLQLATGRLKDVEPAHPRPP